MKYLYTCPNISVEHPVWRRLSKDGASATKSAPLFVFHLCRMCATNSNCKGVGTSICK